MSLCLHKKWFFAWFGYAPMVCWQDHWNKHSSMMFHGKSLLNTWRNDLQFLRGFAGLSYKEVDKLTKQHVFLNWVVERINNSHPQLQPNITYRALAARLFALVAHWRDWYSRSWLWQWHFGVAWSYAICCWFTGEGMQRWSECWFHQNGYKVDSSDILAITTQRNV